MPKRLTRAEKQEQTRVKLLDAAAKLFARQGYASTTVDQVAELAGMTRGAVYSNFAGKEDLLFAVTYRVTRIFDDPVFGDPTLSFPHRIRAAAHHLIRDWKKVREAVLLYSELELLAARDPKVRAHVSRAIGGHLRATGTVIDQGAALEGIDLPLGGLGTLLLAEAGIRGLLSERMRNPDLVDEKLLGDALLVICGYDPADHPADEDGS